VCAGPLGCWRRTALRCRDRRRATDRGHRAVRAGISDLLRWVVLAIAMHQPRADAAARGPRCSVSRKAGLRETFAAVPSGTDARSAGTMPKRKPLPRRLWPLCRMEGSSAPAGERECSSQAAKAKAVDLSASAPATFQSSPGAWCKSLLLMSSVMWVGAQAGWSSRTSSSFARWGRSSRSGPIDAADR
jgi:hypothetical protein